MADRFEFVNQHNQCNQHKGSTEGEKRKAYRFWSRWNKFTAFVLLLNKSILNWTTKLWSVARIFYAFGGYA